MISDGAILDCCRIEPHSIDHGRLQFGTVSIGPKTTVGYGSVISALIETKNQVSICPGTYIMKGDVLPACSAWIGNPSKFTEAISATVPTELGQPSEGLEDR